MAHLVTERKYPRKTSLPCDSFLRDVRVTKSNSDEELRIEMSLPTIDLEALDEARTPPIPIRYFYDMPVYRLPKREYERKRHEYIENNLFPPDLWHRDELIARDKANPNENLGFRDLCTKSYGGAWIFNEIVGYIRLHFMGNQVRGEYFAVQRKRIVRTRRKQFEFLDWNLVPEREIPKCSSSEEIYSIVLEYIEECRKEIKLRFIDSSGLERIGPYINWKALYSAG